MLKKVEFIFSHFSPVAVLATFLNKVWLFWLLLKKYVFFFTIYEKTTFGYFDWFKDSVSILATFSPDGSLCPTRFFIYTVLQMASIFL